MRSYSPSEDSTTEISVVVVTYNRDAALRETLNCLLRQTPAPREIIVVDQSSNHDSATRAFLRQLADSGAINYIGQSEPHAQKARNRAISEASGEVLLFVDDDITADEHLVGAHWRNYVDDEELMAVCGFYTEPGEVPLSELPKDCDDSLTGWIYFPHCYTKRLECHLLPTCNGSIRRQLAIDLGGFDENYTHTLLDDTDFACRLRKLGVKAIHDPLARLVHHKESLGGKRPGGINDYVIADRNRWYIWCYFFWMNFGWGGWRELSRRLRQCVFRKKNIVRPWFLVIAIREFIHGAVRAVAASRSGRRLGFRGESASTPVLSALATTQSATRT